MANLAQSAVTINDTWIEGSSPSRRYTAVEATMVLTGQGGGTNLILAALFGMTYIFEVKSMRSTSKNYIAAPAYDHTGINICALSADTGAFADISDTVKCVVIGY